MSDRVPRLNASWVTCLLLLVAPGRFIGGATQGQATQGQATQDQATQDRATQDRVTQDQAAAEAFEKKFAELRAKQRSVLRQAAEQFAGEREQRLLEEQSATGTAPATIGQLVEILNNSSDSETAITLALQLRAKLPEPLQQRLMQTVDRLAELSLQLDRVKLEYQPHLARQIQTRWEGLTLQEKRAWLSNYFALGGPIPEGLVRRQPSGAPPLPLDPAAAEQFNRFERATSRELRRREQQFLTERQRLRSDMLKAASSVDLASEQAAAIARLVQLLDADYGKGFRGLLLCREESALPSAARERVMRFCKVFRTELAAYRTWRDEQFAALKGRLATLRAQHLAQSQFDRLMAIDLRLHELAVPLRPVWIFAFRWPRQPGSRPESAWLLDVRDDQYLVRFKRDDRPAWLPAEQVLLGPTPDVPIDQLRVATPPGITYNQGSVDETPLQEGDLAVCYRGGAWHAVTVVESSPFGIVIHWDGMDDEYDRIEPRANLRLRSR